MYNFEKRFNFIIQEGLNYGVTIDKSVVTGMLFIVSLHKGSASVEKYLNRIMATYNKHVEQGF